MVICSSFFHNFQDVLMLITLQFLFYCSSTLFSCIHTTACHHVPPYVLSKTSRLLVACVPIFSCPWLACAGVNTGPRTSNCTTLKCLLMITHSYSMHAGTDRDLLYVLVTECCASSFSSIEKCPPFWAYIHPPTKPPECFS